MWFYLRGEEYSAQIDYFVQSIKARRLDGENTFRSALETDQVLEMIVNGGAPAPGPRAAAPAPAPRGVFARLFG